MKIPGYFCLCVLAITGCREEQSVISNAYKAYDEGPHILLNGDSAQALYFTLTDRTWNIAGRSIDKAGDYEFSVGNPIIDSLIVKIVDFPVIESSEYPSAPSVTVISDIEGNFTGLYALLVAWNIIDQNGNWVYGEGHLVMLGDLFDRGADVTPTLWLLYKLETEAREAGGNVHVILGNHEIMIFNGDTRYINKKYRMQSEDTGIPYTDLYAVNTVLGQWIRSKPAIVKIGDLLLSHAGISPEVLALQLDLDEINNLVLEKNIGQVDETTDNFKTLFGTQGIFWYRGWVEHPPAEHVLDEVLDSYNAAHIVIGHTIVPDIRAAFDYKLVMTDVNQSRDLSRSAARALLVEEGVFYKINSRGERSHIQSD